MNRVITGLVEQTNKTQTKAKKPTKNINNINKRERTKTNELNESRRDGAGEKAAVVEWEREENKRVE